jgi:protein-tyrosine phosphatase
MLTAESEGGQLKCHPYWNGREFGPIKLRSLSEKKVSLDIDKSRSNSLVTPPDSSSNASQAELGRRRANTTTSLESSAPTPAQPNLSSQPSNAGDTPYVIVRKFALSHAAHPFSPIREVTQLHYPSWPDFGAPAQPSHLLALVELANVMQRSALPIDHSSTTASVISPTGNEPSGKQQSVQNFDTAPLSWQDSPETGDHARPMLVHCSAGCGRTGAFCTVDSVIDMLKRQRLTQINRANASQPHEKRKRESVSAQGSGKDVEGDVDMEASISPLDTSKDPSTFFRPTLTASKPSGGSSGTDHSGASGEEIDLNWLDDDTVDLVASTVEDFRRQRLSMVQSLRQFVLCYETAIEWIWRLQQRGPIAGPGGRGRARSGSLDR